MLQAKAASGGQLGCFQNFAKLKSISIKLGVFVLIVML